MNSADLRHAHRLRRRRLMGLCLLVPFLIACFALNDWRIRPVWTLFDEGDLTPNRGAWQRFGPDGALLPLAEAGISRSFAPARIAAVTDAVDDDARAALLGRLETIAPRERGALYTALAPHLVREPAFAPLLARQLRLLPPDERSASVRQLLAQPDASDRFAVALLQDFGPTFHDPDTQLDVFIAVADRLKDDAEAPLLLTRHLREIPGIQRRLAATHLLGLDDPGETAFALAALRSFSDLHPISRPKFLYSVMLAEQFGDRRVQEATLLAIRFALKGAEQQELLAAMLHHRALDRELAATIRADFG